MLDTDGFLVVLQISCPNFVACLFLLSRWHLIKKIVNINIKIHPLFTLIFCMLFKEILPCIKRAYRYSHILFYKSFRLLPQISFSCKCEIEFHCVVVSVSMIIVKASLWNVSFFSISSVHSARDQASMDSFLNLFPSFVCWYLH